MRTNNKFVAPRISYLCAPIILVVFAPSFSDPFNLPKLLTLSALAATASVVALFEWKSSLSLEAASSIRKWTILLYILFMLSASTVGLIATDSWSRALWGTTGRYNGLIYFLSVAVISLLVVYFGFSQKDALDLLKWLRIMGIILVSYSTIQYFGFDPVPWNNPYNPIIGTLGNPNFSAAALGLVSILFFGRLFLSENFRDQFKGSGFLFLIFGVWSSFLSWKTDSLQGPLLIGTGLILIAVIIFFKRISSVAGKLMTLFSCGAVGILVLISMAGIGPLGQLLEQYTLRVRAVYAGIALQGMLNRPLTGYGVDSYLVAFRELRDVDFVREFGIGTITNNAHSTPFQIGATFGILVFLLYITITLLALYKSVRVLIAPSKYSTETLILTTLWLLVVAQSLLSIEQIGLGVLNWVLGAAVIASPEYQQKRDETILENRKNRKSAGVHSGFGYTKELAMVLIALSVLPISFIARADAAWKNIVGLEYRNPSDSDFLKVELSKLNKIYLEEPDRLGQILPNLQKANLTKEMESLIESAYAVHQNDTYAVELMASFYSFKGEFASELRELSKITLLDPKNTRAWLRKGEVELNLGMKLEAIISLNKVLEITPISEDADTAKNLLSKIV